MTFEEKNLSQEEFARFYYNYIRHVDRVALAEWIIRILPKSEIQLMLETAK